MNRDKGSRQNYAFPRCLTSAATWAKEERTLAVLTVLCASPPVLSHSVLFYSLWPYELQPTRFLCPWDSPGKNTGMGCHALLQGIFPTQGSNPALPNFRWILYQLSQQGCPRILEWVAYPLSRRSSWPGNQTGVFCIAAGFFTIWATRETPKSMKMSFNACKESDTTEQLT